VPGVWSQLQAIVGSTSQGTWVGWTVISGKVQYPEDTAISRQRDHSETEGDSAEFKTMGEGTDVCEGTGGEAAGESCGSTQEKDGAEERDGESEGVGSA